MLFHQFFFKLYYFANTFGGNVALHQVFPNKNPLPNHQILPTCRNLLAMIACLWILRTMLTELGTKGEYL